MKPGDVLCYADGRKYTIVDFVTIRGRPGVQVDNPAATSFSDRFLDRGLVDQMIDAGIWTVIPGTPTEESTHEHPGA